MLEERIKQSFSVAIVPEVYSKIYFEKYYFGVACLLFQTGFSNEGN